MTGNPSPLTPLPSKRMSREETTSDETQSRMVAPNVSDEYQRSRAREALEIALLCDEVDRRLDELRGVFMDARSLDLRVRRAAHSRSRRRIGYAAADCSWFLMHELSGRDQIVFDALGTLCGGLGGVPFATTIGKIHTATRGPIGFSTVGASLHRLHHLGLITYEPRRGPYGSKVTLR